jgi:hypothetical protein
MLHLSKAIVGVWPIWHQHSVGEEEGYRMNLLLQKALVNYGNRQEMLYSDGERKWAGAQPGHIVTD